MITLSDLATSVLGSTSKLFCSVESWRGEELLADDIPVMAPSEEVDRTQRVPERLTFSVPRVDDNGVRWAPVGEAHPLAANGQRLRVELGVGVGAGRVEWYQRGWFLLQDAQPVGNVVNVEAVGLLSLIDEARLVTPYQPAGLISETVQGLIEPALTVEFDPALVDRAVPTSVNLDEDRLDGVFEILDAWTADAAVDAQGVVQVFPAAAGFVSVLTLTDGVGGTVIEASGSSTRTDAYNVVVARGADANGTQLQGIAYDTVGPKRYGGEFHPLPVPFFFYSPLLTTAAQCQGAAETIRDRKRRQTAPGYNVDMVPHPGLQAGDGVTLVTEAHGTIYGTVESLTLPYLAGGGTMRLLVREVIG